MNKLPLLLLLSLGLIGNSYADDAEAKALDIEASCGPYSFDLQAVKASVKHLEVETKTLIKQLEVERKTLIKQLEELRIENNKNLSDINNIKLDIYLLSKEIGKASELVLSNNFAKRRLEITQLTKDIKQRIEILDSTPNPKSYSQVEFINDPFLQPYINTGQDLEICTKSPEGSPIRVGEGTWYDQYNQEWL